MISCPTCQHHNRPTAHFCAQCGAPLQLQDKYRIVGLLGRGGFSAVYEAEHLGLDGARYAIKELFPDAGSSPAQRQTASDQFRFEASTLARLNFPALPKVMDFFSERGRDYLVMEFVPGDTLQELIAKSTTPLPEIQVLQWADALCRALIYLHSQNPPVIHRDIKPANIKRAPDGTLKLLDFGIAKLLAGTSSTQTAARAVTPPYAPIEQYGTGTDARSDIYALGVTLYEMLTRQLPPEAPDRVTRGVIAPRTLNPSLSSATEAIVLKAMAEKQADRFQSAHEMQNAIRTRGNVVGQNVSAQAGAQVAAVGKATRARVPAFVWFLIPLFIAAILGVGYLAMSVGESNARISAASTVMAGQTQIALGGLATATAQARETFAAGTATTALTNRQTQVAADLNGTTTAQSANATATSKAQATDAANRAATASAAASQERETATAEVKLVQANASATAAQSTVVAQGIATLRAAATQVQETVERGQTATAQAIFYEAARRTATAERQQTSTLQAERTRTARSRATESARATATARARTPQIVFGPSGGSLLHEDDESIKYDRAPVQLNNFIVTARFYNPFDSSENSWDYGFGFRETTDSEYRLVVNSNQSWNLRLATNANGTLEFKGIAEGSISNLDISVNGSNLVRLEVRGGEARFYVNGDFIDTLDVSELTSTGDVWIGTGFFKGSEITGKSTRYQDFTVWTNP